MTSRISRRTLAIGAAWTAPAITVAAAAPAFAASPRSIKVDLGTTGGKWTDASGDGYIAQGIVITVLGSAGKPLPGAQVTLRIRNYSGNTNTFWFVSDPAVSSTDAQSGTHLSSITLTADANGQVRLDNQPASGYLRHGSDGESGGSFFEVLLNGKVIGGFTLYNSSAAGGTDRGVQPTAG